MASTLAHPTSKKAYESAARRIEQSLQRRVEGASPLEALFEIAKVLRALEVEPGLHKQYPPYRVLRTLEATLAFGKSHSSENFKLQALQDCMGILREEDPGVTWVLNKGGIHAALYVLNHQQFAVQKGRGDFPFRRQLCLLPDASACPLVDGLMHQMFGAGLEAIHLALIVVGAIGHSDLTP